MRTHGFLNVEEVGLQDTTALGGRTAECVRKGFSSHEAQACSSSSVTWGLATLQTCNDGSEPRQSHVSPVTCHMPAEPPVCCTLEGRAARVPSVE